MGSNDNLNKGFQEKSSRETLVDKLTKEIESNLTNDQFGVDSLAEAVGMSRSSLHRKLHKLLDISTSQFIREDRLKRALEILKEEEEVTASEVAYRVGFSSATYFNTCFHKFYGFTPGEVKFRTISENEKLNNLLTPEKVSLLQADSKTLKSKKSILQKSRLWVILGMIILFIGFFHSYTTSKKSMKTKGKNTVLTEKSIAVLPFKNLTGNPELEYVSDGMTDAVISRFTKINSIDKIIPFTSILSYKKTNKTIKEIASELGVEKVLQGNLQISGDKIKINLQMINGLTNDHLWSEEYIREWKTDEIFKMQTEVVEGIAANMSAIITDKELTFDKNIPTKSKQVYSPNLQAEFLRHKRNETTFTLAMPLYEKAINLDSNFMEAYLSLPSMWNYEEMILGIYNEQLAWKNAEGQLEKALKIDPTNKDMEEELYTRYFNYDWNFEQVEQFYLSKSKGSFYVSTPIINKDFAIKTGRFRQAINTTDK
jgi:TolB-like protein/AraC-like DNA-binding protein